MPHFPLHRKDDTTMEFLPAPFQAPQPPFAVLAFPWQNGKVLVCDIKGRGWCVPSGKIEPGETPIQTARRETSEEAGATLAGIVYIGTYRITRHTTNQTEIRFADCYAGEIESLREITCPEESRARMLLDPQDLPRLYHFWNDLAQAVFEHSRQALLARPTPTDIPD